MAEAKEYKGSCHCGLVRYRVTADLTGPLISCNCSICLRAGTVLAFVPAAQFTLEKGEDALTDYQFGKKSLHHPFCATCGVKSFAHGKGPDGSKMYAINARCLEGVNLQDLTIKEYDGAST